MQSTGQTAMHVSQPLHSSLSSFANTLGSFVLAIDAEW